MMQTDIDAEVDLVILRVPPARVDDLVCICRRINRPIRDAIVDAVMTIVVDPIAKTVRPVASGTCVADPSLRWRRAGRRRRGANLARLIACKSRDDVVVRVVGSGMVEDGFLRSRSGVGRIKKGRDSLRRRGADTALRRGAAYAEEESTEQEGD